MHDLIRIFASQEPVGLAVTALIVVLLLIGLLDALKAQIALRSEREALRRAKAALGRLSSLLASPEQMLTALRLTSATAVGRRVLRVLQLRRAGLGHREALRELTVEHLGGGGALARHIAAILTVMGLLGTVVGMSIAMMRMAGALHQADSVEALTELTRALSGTLEGMKTAFACTLAGLIAALLLSGVNYAVRRRQSRALEDIEAFVTCELLPAFETVDPEENSAAKAFASVLSEGTEKISALGEQMAKSAESYAGGSDRLADAATKLADSVRDLGSGIGAMTRDQQQFTRVMSENREAIQSVAQLLQEEMRRIGDFSERSNKLLTERVTAIEKAIETITTHDREFHTLIERTSSEMQHAFQKMLEDVNKNYREGVTGYIQKNSDNLARLLEEYSAKLQSFADMMMEVHLDGRAQRAAGVRQ
jgi:hypothetical protein